MDINDAVQSILKNKFSVSYKNGIKHFSSGNVKSVELKEAKNFTSIYGKVQDKAKVYSTQIRINNNTKKIELICNCDLGREVRETGVILPCEHIIATLIQFNKNNNIVINKKEDINIKLRFEENFTNEYKFKAHLFLEGRNRIKISSKYDLTNTLGKEGVFSFRNINYSKENIELLKFLGKINFKVKDEDIKNLLILCDGIDFVIKIDSLEYKGKVKKEMMPLKFTLKLVDNRIKLQTLKSKVRSINSEETVFLYNNCIYIPPYDKCRAYNPLYKIFSKKSYTFVKKESLHKVIRVLESIGELSVHDEIKNILAKDCNINLYFEKIKDELYCKLIIPKDEEYLKTSDKVKRIEEILFSNRFTRKGELYYFLGEDFNIMNLLKSNISDLCEIKSSKDVGEIKILDASRIKGNINKSSDDIEFSLNIDGIENSEWNLAVNSYAEGNEFYRFSNYNFIDFKDKQVTAIMEFLKFINFKGSTINLPIGYEEATYKMAHESGFINVIKKDQETDSVSTVNPKGLKGKLRDYQVEGLLWLQNKKEKGLFGILADDMGLGKTIQTISFILNNKNDKTMIITPASLVYNWKDEFRKFAPSLKIACVHGSKSNRMEVLKNITMYDVILTSYGTLNMDAEFYKNYNFDNLIIDEAQTIKNSKSKVSQNVKSIKAKVRFALTGTPIENNYLEIWNIFDFLKPGYLFSQKEFKSKFLNNNSEQIKYLKLIIKPFILRRTKNQVLKELPDKIERTFYVDMTKEQKNYYKLSLKKFIKQSKENTNSIIILSLLTKLRQIALDPSIIDDSYNGGSGKIDKALEVINKCVGNHKKILVFSQFTSVLDKLKQKLDLIDESYFYLDGSTKSGDRVMLCNKFNNSKDVFIFLISLKAGGTGLNLTSAEVVLHFDPWWNPAVENQATDRAHRIGQKNQVEVIKIITKDTIEEKMMKLKEDKNNIFASLLSDDNSYDINSTKLTKEEIKYLLLEDN